MKAFKIKKKNEKRDIYISSFVKYFEKPFIKRKIYFKVNPIPEYKNKYITQEENVFFSPVVIDFKQS